MSSEIIQSHHQAKKDKRQKEMEAIKEDPSQAFVIGQKNFCLSGADLANAKQGKHFVLFKDKK